MSETRAAGRVSVVDGCCLNSVFSLFVCLVFNRGYPMFFILLPCLPFLDDHHLAFIQQDSLVSLSIEQEMLTKHNTSTLKVMELERQLSS